MCIKKRVGFYRKSSHNITNIFGKDLFSFILNRFLAERNQIFKSNLSLYSFCERIIDMYVMVVQIDPVACHA